METLAAAPKPARIRVGEPIALASSASSSDGGLRPEHPAPPSAHSHRYFRRWASLRRQGPAETLGHPDAVGGALAVDPAAQSHAMPSILAPSVQIRRESAANRSRAGGMPRSSPDRRQQQPTSSLTVSPRRSRLTVLPLPRSGAETASQEDQADVFDAIPQIGEGIWRVDDDDSDLSDIPASTQHPQWLPSQTFLCLCCRVSSINAHRVAGLFAVSQGAVEVVRMPRPAPWIGHLARFGPGTCVGVRLCVCRWPASWSRCLRRCNATTLASWWDCWPPRSRGIWYAPRVPCSTLERGFSASHRWSPCQWLFTFWG